MERVWFAHRAVSAFHTGATATDMEHYLIPMIQKKPSNIILHVGKNDAITNSLEQSFEVESSSEILFTHCRVFISTPTLRTDDAKAKITVSQLTKHLCQLKIDRINNNNIDV